MSSFSELTVVFLKDGRSREEVLSLCSVLVYGELDPDAGNSAIVICSVVTCTSGRVNAILCAFDRARGATP